MGSAIDIDNGMDDDEDGFDDDGKSPPFVALLKDRM